MFETVETGTGGAAKVAGYHIGGKTGTAEKQPRSAKNYLLSFAGFAPVEDPQLFVYVVVDVPNYPPGPQQAHSSFASGIFAKIMKDALPYMNVFPEEGTEGENSAGETAEEGINAPSESETEAQGQDETPAETKAYETDEYIDEGYNSGVPDAVPADPNASSAAAGKTQSQASESSSVGASESTEGSTAETAASSEASSE